MKRVLRPQRRRPPRVRRWKRGRSCWRRRRRIMRGCRRRGVGERKRLRQRGNEKISQIGNGVNQSYGVHEESKRDSSHPQADAFAGAKAEEKIVLLRSKFKCSKTR